MWRSTAGRAASSGAVSGRREGRILLVDHKGARSGATRTSPLIYHEHDGAVVVVASKAGQPTDPAWCHNLSANPDTTVQIGTDVRRVRARRATEEERGRLWPQLVATFPAYDIYERNATSRTLPVLVLDPR